MSQLPPVKSAKVLTNLPPIKSEPNVVFWLLLIAIVLLSANMRAPIMALGSIAPIIQDALSLSEADIGWLGAIPVLMFAFAALISPRIGKYFGNGNTLIAALVFLTIGIILRSAWASWTGFLLGTVLFSIAIGFANTLVAPIIKERSPHNIALITGIYSLSMSIAAGIVAGTVLPLSKVVGWQWALGGWSIFSLLALIVWLVLRRVAGKSDKAAILSAQPTHQESVSSAHSIEHNVSIWRAPLAWQLALFMGLQSLLYFTVASFLPSILVSKGLTPIQAGNMGSIFQFMAPFVIIIMTFLIRRGMSIQVVAISLALLNVFGMLGIAYLPIQLAWLWSALMGLSCAGIFTLCIMLFSLRTYTPNQASQLSGMTQTIAYLIAFLGPLGSGWLHELTHSWTYTLLFILLSTLLNVVAAWFVSRPVMIDGKPVLASVT